MASSGSNLLVWVYLSRGRSPTFNKSAASSSSPSSLELPGPSVVGAAPSAIGTGVLVPASCPSPSCPGDDEVDSSARSSCTSDIRSD
eukprot:1997716-Pyramimonas_sp.AAC.2